MHHFAEGKYLHNHPDAYWCPDCHRFTLNCSRLVEPLTSPIMKLDHWKYLEATWERNILQITMNTGERFQYFKVSLRLAIEFVRTALRLPAPYCLMGGF